MDKRQVAACIDAVFDYVKANPHVSRAAIAQALSVDVIRVGNALAKLRSDGRLFCTGLGRFTTWSAIPPEPEQIRRDPLMAMFG
ncbi:MAG: hypothetical protein V4451_16110 [Pseudomonadota bacterium]